MKAWLTKDNLQNYLIWNAEPFLIKTVHNMQFFANYDDDNRIQSYMVTHNERYRYGFPELETNQCKEIDIDDYLYYYYFLED